MGITPEYALIKAADWVGVFNIYSFEEIVSAVLKLEVAIIWIGVDVLPIFSGEYVIRRANGLR